MIKTRTQWWKTVDEHWLDILNIFHMTLPMGGIKYISHVGNVAPNPSIEKLAVEIERCKINRDPHLCRYLFSAWSRLPDDERIHNLDGWYTLCELLSEETLLYEDE